MSATNRNRRQAVLELLATFRAIVDCVTSEPLIIFGNPPYPLAVRFRALIAPLNGSPLGFSMLHGFDFDDRDVIHTRNYQYTLYDADGAEFLAYHWHPANGVQIPHLHVRPYAQPIAVGLYHRAVAIEKKHLPTSRVSLEAIVRSLIEEFDIAARHPGWQYLLATSERSLVAVQSWATRPP